MPDTITMPNPEVDLDRARKWQGLALQSYWAADEEIARSSLRCLALAIRAEWPDAKHLMLDQSDQGDHAYLSSVTDEEDNELYQDSDWDDEWSSCLDNRTADAWIGPEDPITGKNVMPYIVSGGHGERRGFYELVLDIDQLLEAFQQPRLLPNEVEMWTLVVNDGQQRFHHVTVYGSKAEAEAAFRANYTGELDEGDTSGMTLEELADYLSLDFAIDSHVVTIPEDKKEV